MEFLKQPRFWVTALVIVGAVVLTALGKLTGDAFGALVVGLLVRLGADKGTASVKTIAPVLLAGALLAGCCTTPRCLLHNALDGVNAANKATLPLLEKKLKPSIVAGCPKPVQPECPAYQKAKRVIETYQAASNGAVDNLKTVNRLCETWGVK